MNARHLIAIVFVLFFIVSFSGSVFATPDGKKPDETSFNNMFKKETKSSGRSDTIGIAAAYDSCSTSLVFAQLSCGTSKTDSGTLSTYQAKWHKIYAYNTGTLKVALKGPSAADYDLFIFNNCSGTSTPICAGTSSSSSETCSVSVTAGKYYYVRVMASSGTGSYTINASLSCSTLPSCDSTSYSSCSSAATMTSGTAKSGLCGSSQYYKITTTQKCTITWTMTPQTGSDYDLYVKNSASSCPSISNYDCRPYLGVSNQEICSSTLTAGTYYTMVTKFGTPAGSYSIKADVTNCVSTCTSHYSSSCYSNDLYWYNSCNVREDLKQDCGDNYCGSWGSKYCKNGDLYISQTCYNRGCSGSSCYSNPWNNEDLVMSCEGRGCSNGACVPPAGAFIRDYTPNIETGYIGSVVWETVGDVTETGILVIHEDLIGTGLDVESVPVALNNFKRYAAVIKPKYQKGYIYAVPYVVNKTGGYAYGAEIMSYDASCSYDGSCSGSLALATTQNSAVMPAPKRLDKNKLPKKLPTEVVERINKLRESRVMSLAATCFECSDTVIPYYIEEIDLFALGWSGIKLFTIGSCLDDGVFTFWCAFDVGTTVAIVVPDPTMGALDYAATTAKLSKLASGKKLIIEMKTIEKLSTSARKLTLYIDNIGYKTTGSNVAKGEILGIMRSDFVTGDILTAYKSLSKWFLTKGDAAISALKSKLFTNTELDKYALNAVDLNKLNTFVAIVDEGPTVARTVDKFKSSTGLKDAIGNTFEPNYVMSSGKNVDVRVTIDSQNVYLEAKTIADMTVSNLRSRLMDSWTQLSTGVGEKISVIKATSTSMTQTEIIAAVNQWLKDVDLVGKVKVSVTTPSSLEPILI